MNNRRTRLLILALSPIAALDGPTAPAEASERGLTSIRVEYQYIRTGAFYDDSIIFGSGGDVGHTDSHALLFAADFALSERWQLFASVPYIQKRHTGANPHDFSFFSDFDPPDRTLVDDGDYHGGFQDLAFGVQYLAEVGPVQVGPYVSYGLPVTDYPFYGKAIIGSNLWTVPVGVRLEYQPYFSDWHFSADVAYVFSEKPLDVNVDYWLLYGAAGYYFTPRFYANLFMTYKDIPKGLHLPQDFGAPPDYSDLSFQDSELFWQHDRLMAHRTTNVGVGIDYLLTSRYEVSVTYFRTIDAYQTNEIENAYSVGFTVRFGSGNPELDAVFP